MDNRDGERTHSWPGICRESIVVLKYEVIANRRNVSTHIFKLVVNCRGGYCYQFNIYSGENCIRSNFLYTKEYALWIPRTQQDTLILSTRYEEQSLNIPQSLWMKLMYAIKRRKPKAHQCSGDILHLLPEKRIVTTFSEGEILLRKGVL